MHFTYLALVSVIFLGPHSSMALQDFEQAENSIKKLVPSEFPELPLEVRRKAEQKGCEIPQTFVSDTPHNVISGSFAAKGTKDWALLCSKKGKSSIFIVWEKQQACSSEIALAEDKDFLQTIDEKKSIGYSRALSSAKTKLDHQGIDDAFAEKASVIHFCENGKWLALSGAD